MKMEAHRLSNTSAKSAFSQGGTPLVEFEELNVHTPLRLIKKREEIDHLRPSIQAKLSQRICFYQYQVNSISKSEFTACNPRLLRSWMLVWVGSTLTLGVVGWYFLLAFFGIFAKEQHFYITKMVPLAYGMIWIYFFLSLIDLTRSLDITLVLMDHFINAIYYQNPWNRCDSVDVEIMPKSVNGTSYEYQCLNYDDFRNVVLSSGSYHFASTLFHNKFSCFILNKYDKCVQISHTIYTESRGNAYVQLDSFLDFFFCFILVAGCVVAYRQIYKLPIWKVLFYSDVIYCFVYFVANVHIFYMNNLKIKTRTLFHVGTLPDEVMFTIKELCTLLCACYTFAPPSVHFLVSRSKNVNPGKESFAMVFCVVMHTFFFILTNFTVRTYVIQLMGGLDMGSVFVFPRQYNVMDIWLVYFASLPPGNMLTLLFLTSTFMMEYVSMIITFQCVVEMYAAEFRLLQHWVIIAVIVIGLSVLYLLFSDERCLLQVYGRIIVMILEVFFIYIFYSVERILDDLQFFYGLSPSKMRYMCIMTSIALEIVSSKMEQKITFLVWEHPSIIILFWVLVFPVIAATEFIICKNFICLTITVHEGIVILFFWNVDIDYVKYFAGEPNNSYWIVPYIIVFCLVIPLISCGAYMAFHIYLKRKDWNLIFVPHDLWGPFDFYPRQLRKEFQSRKYIASQAPRILARYLMKNAEPENYKIDIAYDFANLWKLMNMRKASHP